MHALHFISFSFTEVHLIRPFAATAKPNIATINALLLHGGGVLRFVMEGERADGALKDFEYNPLQGNLDQNANAINANAGKGKHLRPPLPLPLFVLFIRSLTCANISS